MDFSTIKSFVVASQHADGSFHAGYGSSALVPGGVAQHNPAPIVHVCADADDGFKHLLSHVAPNAYDANSQFGDAPKCHPNTRMAVLNLILDWMYQTVMRVQWIMWLNGAAGAGKSAIMRSIVELCADRNIPFAAFFFYRSDATRNTPKDLVGTILYQLIGLYPELVPLVVPKIQFDPLIFTKSLDSQFKYLIFDPLRQLHSQSPLQRAIVLLIDGLDECDGGETQAHIIRIIAEFIQAHRIPFIALFSSRVENDIDVAFRSKKLKDLLIKITLDDRYLPDEDIRLFLRDSFEDIRQTHPLSNLLDENWPAEDILDELVLKSSGQFIYAAAVMKFVSTSRLHPAQQLDIVRGLRPTGPSGAPFAQLDALYRHALSQVHDIKGVLSILAYYILAEDPRIADYCVVHDATESDVQVLMADLRSVISLESGEVTFLHASLPDFLLDSSRSHDYHIDRSKWCTYFLKQTLKASDPYGTLLQDINAFLPYTECDDELRDAISQSKWDGLYRNESLIQYLGNVKALDFGDNGKLFHTQLSTIAKYFTQFRPECIVELESHFDIPDISETHQSGASSEQRPYIGVDYPAGLIVQEIAPVDHSPAPRPAITPFQPTDSHISSMTRSIVTGNTTSTGSGTFIDKSSTGSTGSLSGPPTKSRKERIKAKAKMLVHKWTP